MSVELPVGTVATFSILGNPASWKRREASVRKVRGRHVVHHRNPDGYELNKQAVAWRLLSAIGAGNQALWQAQRLSLVLDVYFATRRVQDADRVLNLVLDAGKGVVWHDDTWTTFENGSLVVRPHLDSVAPRIEGSICTIGPLLTPAAKKRARGAHG